MSTDVFCVRLGDLPNLADKLAEQIKCSVPSIDHILYIESAGRLLGHLLQFRLGGNISGIRVERPTNMFKEMFVPLIPYIPERWRSELRKAELKGHQNWSKRNIKLVEDLPQKDKHLLIVDDALDTGYTMRAVLDLLYANGFKRNLISIAVINTTLQTSVVKPDFLCFNTRIICFPWSRDSKERGRYLQIYRNCPHALREIQSQTC